MSIMGIIPFLGYSTSLYARLDGGTASATCTGYV